MSGFGGLREIGGLDARSGSKSRHSFRPAAFFNFRAAQALLIVLLAGALSFGVWIYGNGLRDARYFDGWVLAGGIILQLCFHLALKTASISPKSVKRWRKFHILLGVFLIAAFVSHCDFSLPDSAFEWALWSCFVVVTLSGIFGAYLAWSLRTNRDFDDRLGIAQITTQRAALTQEVRAVIALADPATSTLALPAAPEGAWFVDLYANHLNAFFQTSPTTIAHLIGARRRLQKVTDEIDGLARYVDRPNQDKLAAIKVLVSKKHQLDSAAIYLALTKAWLFVHVPATYALVVLAVMHTLVAYAFSSGDW